MIDYDVAIQTPKSAYEFTVEDISGFSRDAVKDHAFKVMEELEGWCSPKKASAMMDLIFLMRPYTIVEIGVFGGKSLIPMAIALKSLGEGVIYGVDPWDSAESIIGEMDEANRQWWSKIDHEKIYQGLLAKVKKFKLQKQVQLLKATSASAPSIPYIDILHIDGNHSEETSVFDVLKWVPLVRPGGLIIFDDLDWVSTRKASSLLNEFGVKFLEYKDANVWGVWIKHP